MHKIAVDLDTTVIFPLLAISLILLGKSIRLVWRRGGHPSFISLPAISTALLTAFFVTTDPVKVRLGAGIYQVMALAAVITFFAALTCASLGISRQERTGPERAVELIMCIVVMLVAAGGALHFFHQEDNAKHVLCPHCDDSDSDD